VNLDGAVARYRVLHAGHYIIGVMLESLSDVELEAGNYDAALERALESVEFYRNAHPHSATFGHSTRPNSVAGGRRRQCCAPARARAAYEVAPHRQRGGSRHGTVVLAAVEATAGKACAPPGCSAPGRHARA